MIHIKAAVNSYLKQVFYSRNFCIATFFCLVTFVSCKKLVDVDAPVTNVNESNVYAEDASAISVLTGIYTNMSRFSDFTGLSSVTLYAGLSADELSLFPGSTNQDLIGYYTNALSANVTQTVGGSHWKVLYNYIYYCNSAIDGLERSNSLTPEIKIQLLGEAKFLRAFFYFYLVNLFGDVPLVLNTDHSINALLAKTSKSMVYQQIIEDLKEAKSKLNIEYLNGKLQKYTSNIERVRPNNSAATALLARVYLFTNDWANAEAEATLVINNGSLYDTVSLNNVFLKNSKEAIWQLQPVFNGRNTEDGWIFILPANGPDGLHPVYLNNFLLNSFESNDQRKIRWVNNVTAGNNTYYFPYKYKSATLNASVTEYLMVLRLGETYLIRAEARAQQNKINDGQSDLNLIRKRAGLPNVIAGDKNSLLTAILHERQVELFTEWGHRWFDLKRTETIVAVMSIVTPFKSGGNAWRPYQKYYPIPYWDIDKNPNLIQTPGY